MIYPGVTPTPGQVAYVAHSGYISNASIIPDGKLEVGFFDSAKDEDGYALYFRYITASDDSPAYRLHENPLLTVHRPAWRSESSRDNRSAWV